MLFFLFSVIVSKIKLNVKPPHSNLVIYSAIVVPGDTIQITFDLHAGFFLIHSAFQFQANIGTHCHNFDSRCNWSHSNSIGLYAVGDNPNSVAEIVATESGNLTLTVGYQSLHCCSNLTGQSVGSVPNLSVRNQAPVCVIQADLGEVVLTSSPLHNNMAVDGYLSHENRQHWDESQQIPSEPIGKLAFQFSSLQSQIFTPFTSAQNLIEFQGTTERTFVSRLPYDQLKTTPGFWLNGDWTQMSEGRYVPPLDHTTVVIVVSIVVSAVVIGIIVGVISCWQIRVKHQAGLNSTHLPIESDSYG
jgi:hypothetical protein